MRTLIVVVTCPRPSGISYLEETVRLLDEAGAESHKDKMIVSDGPLGQRKIPASWSLDENGGGQCRGTRFVFSRVLQIAVSLQAERLLYFEDDIVPCKNAVTLMLKTDVAPNLAYLSFFAMRHFFRSAIKNAIYVTNATGPLGRGLSGAQAIMYPRKTIDYLATCDIISYYHPNLRTKTSSCDKAMSFLVEVGPPDLPKLAGFHVPSLFEHIGSDSVSHPERPFKKSVARKWPGQKFDALSLPPLPLLEMSSRREPT